MTDTKTPEKTETAASAAAAKMFNLPQIAGGALAAVTAAALGSQLGVAGTLAGAAVASVVAGVASTLYTRGFERTRDGVKKIVLGDDGNVEVITVVEDASPTSAAGTASSAMPSRKRSKWQHPVTMIAGMALTAAVTFVVAMGVITGWEFTSGTTLSGKPGTTIGQAKQPSTTPTATASATPSATQTATPSATPTPTPSATPSATPTATPSVTATPTPAATSSETASQDEEPAPVTAG